MSREKNLIYAVYYMHAKGYLSQEEFRQISDCYPDYPVSLVAVLGLQASEVTDMLGERRISSEEGFRALLVCASNL